MLKVGDRVVYEGTYHMDLSGKLGTVKRVTEECVVVNMIGMGQYNLLPSSLKPLRAPEQVYIVVSQARGWDGETFTTKEGAEHVAKEIATMCNSIVSVATLNTTFTPTKELTRKDY